MQLRINDYMAQFQKAISTGCIGDCIELMRTALIEFPNNYLILSNLMYALYVASEDEVFGKEHDEEIIMIGERILNYCHDDTIRMEAKSLLFRHYCDTDRKQKALDIVNSLPDENSSKESNIYWALEGEDRVKYLKERITSYTSSLAWAIWALSIHSGAIDEKIGYLKSIQLIESIIYEENDYGEKFRKRLLNNISNNKC